MAKKRDITGQIFSHLTVIRPIGTNKHHNIVWECQCDCGNITNVFTGNLTSGNIKSCGCQQHPIKHGDSKRGNVHRLYKIYNGMLNRCYDKNNNVYKYYGGKRKPVIVCDEWRNNYENFKKWALSNGYKDNLTIDRIDGNGNYEPNNCRWITQAEQNRNKDDIILINIDGEDVTLSMIAEAVGLCEWTIRNRYLNGVRGLKLIRVTNALTRPTITEIDGTIYENLRELSDKTGIKHTTLQRRYEKGIRGEELIKSQKKQMSMEINGVFHTLKQWSEITGVNYDTLRHRYRMGIRGTDFIKPPTREM